MKFIVQGSYLIFIQIDIFIKDRFSCNATQNLFVVLVNSSVQIMQAFIE